MALTSKITGVNLHRAQLRARRMNNPAVQAALLGVANVIAKDAKASIIEGGIPSPNHIPSAPGQPPNADTHRLDQSIRAYGEGHTPPTVFVVAEAPYGSALEFGTSTIAERPFLRPAVNRNRGLAAEKISGLIRSKTGG